MKISDEKINGGRERDLKHMTELRKNVIFSFVFMKVSFSADSVMSFEGSVLDYSSLKGS